MIRCLENIATFMEALALLFSSSLWTTISNQFQTFFAKLPCVLPLKVSLNLVFHFKSLPYCLQATWSRKILMFCKGLKESLLATEWKVLLRFSLQKCCRMTVIFSGHSDLVISCFQLVKK